MITRILSRRLDRLETRFLPPDDEPTQHTILFVDADGSATDSMVMKFGGWAPSRSPRGGRRGEWLIGPEFVMSPVGRVTASDRQRFA